MTAYPVAWRDDSGPVHVGRLELGEESLRLEAGTYRSGRLTVLSVRYRDVLKAEMATPEARVEKRPTVAVNGSSGALFIAPNGLGLAREVLGLLKLTL
jgi:hypothetical protein